MGPMRGLPTTIRVQIVMAFSVCFAFMAVIIAVNHINFKHLAHSMQVSDLAEELNSTILEMRRYEKNYFLYRQDFNYEENVTYTNHLHMLLERDREELVQAFGTDNYELSIAYVENYRTAMAELHRSSCAVHECEELEARIRGTGQNLLILADQLVNGERRAIDRHLRKLIPLPLVSLVGLVVLLAFVVFFIGEKVVRPLARITRESAAVASGALQRITPFYQEGNEIHTLVSTINRMVSELEQRQEQLVQSRKIASIGTLTAGIAHEINNPLNNISLILESMLEDGDEMDRDEARRLLHEAVDQTDRANEIVKNLLEFSRVSRPRVETVNIDELVDKTARLVRNELRLKQVDFTKTIDIDVPDVRFDKGGLQQVLVNLFMNSIQAMETGGVLKVEVSNVRGEREIRLDVIDNGPGIPPENLDRVFDPFFTTKKEGVGTGLGLSVSYNIITKNGGRITVDSQMGHGTRFTIFLPSGGNHHA
jgi:two-component system NtrC family sensor kinase